MMTKPVEVAAAPAPAIDVRFGQVGLIQVRIRTTDPGAILDELTGRVASAPLFFQRTGVCLDLTVLGREPAGRGDARRSWTRCGARACCQWGSSASSAAMEALSAALELPVLAPFRPQTQAVAPVVQPRRSAPSPVFRR